MEEAGYSPEEVEAVLEGLKAGGTTAEQAKARGFTSEQAAEAGYTSAEMAVAGGRVVQVVGWPFRVAGRAVRWVRDGCRFGGRGLATTSQLCAYNATTSMCAIRPSLPL